MESKDFSRIQRSNTMEQVSMERRLYSRDQMVKYITHLKAFESETKHLFGQDVSSKRTAKLVYLLGFIESHGKRGQYRKAFVGIFAQTQRKDTNTLMLPNNVASSDQPSLHKDESFRSRADQKRIEFEAGPVALPAPSPSRSTLGGVKAGSSYTSSPFVIAMYQPHV